MHTFRHTHTNTHTLLSSTPQACQAGLSLAAARGLVRFPHKLWRETHIGQVGLPAGGIPRNRVLCEPGFSSSSPGELLTWPECLPSAQRELLARLCPCHPPSLCWASAQPLWLLAHFSKDCTGACLFSSPQEQMRRGEKKPGFGGDPLAHWSQTLPPSLQA